MQMSINTMALPPIMKAGSDYLKQLVSKDVVCGKKNICLAISEPGKCTFDRIGLNVL